MRRLTAKPWFGPKKYAGWNLRPAAIQGWLVLIVFVIAMGLADVYYAHSRNELAFIGLVILLFAILGAVATLSGDHIGHE